MAGPKPDSVYNAVPSVESGGGGGTYNSAHATSAAFGGQTGEAIAGAGTEGFNAAIKYQGMINETTSNNAETDYITKAGQLTGNFKSLEGLEANAAIPKYQEDLISLRQNIRNSLNPAAAKMFDATTRKHEAYTLSDAYSYGANQIKKATLDSNNAIAETSISNAGNLSVAQDDKRFGEQLGDINHSVSSMMELQGWGQHANVDEKTGKVSFNDSPEGKQAAAVYNAELNKRVSAAQENRYRILADQNVNTAYQKYTDNRDTIPGDAQVKLDAFFTPRIRDSQARTAADNGIASAKQSYQETLTNPVRVANSDSAIQWTMDNEKGFVSNDGGKGPTNFGINQESNPNIDVTKLTKDHAAKIMHDKYWLGIGADKMQPQFAQVAFDAAVNQGVDKAKSLISQAGGDPQKLIDLRRQEYQRLATNNPERYGQYLKGWDNRLDDLQKQISSDSFVGPQTAVEAKQTTSNPPSEADYYKNNYSKLIDDVRQKATTQHPDDAQFVDNAVAKFTTHLDTTIKAQTEKYAADNDVIGKAMIGGFNKGTPPTSIEEMLSGGQDVKDAWGRMLTNNPTGALAIETRLAKMANKVDASAPDVIKQRGGLENMKVEEPNKFINYDFSTLAGKLPASEIGKYQEQASKMRTGSGLDAENSRASNVIKAVDDMLPANWKGSKKDSDKEESSAFKGNLLLAIKEAQGTDGKLLGRDEIRKIASDMLGNVSVKGAGFFGGTKEIPSYKLEKDTNPLNITSGKIKESDTNKFEIQGHTVVAPNNLYVPETFRQGFIRSYMSQSGKMPSESTIQKFYLTSKATQ